MQAVASGLEALDLLNRDPKIRVVITDWMMPDVNGIALCRLARQLQRENYLYLMVLTVKEDEDDLRVALEAGADAFIPKNLGLSRLDSQLKVVRRGAHLESELQRQLANLRGKEEELERRNSELSERNRQLSEARHRAESGSRAKTDFLANMSHEVRTPMNGVLGLASLLLGTELNAEQREYAELVKLSAENLLSLISDILDLSKIEAGKIDISDDHVDIHSFLFKTLAPLAPQAEKKGLSLTCRVDFEGEESLTSDLGKLRQILTNLVGNALKFTAEGGVEVVTAHHRDSEQYSFTVRDTGRGIPLEQQASIFEAFTQVEDSLHRHFEGSGLGLTISRRLAEAMGGTLVLSQSHPGGSEFVLTVPAPPSSAPSRQLPRNPEESGLAWNAGLLVGLDDAKLLGPMLERWGIKTQLFSDSAALPAGLDLLVLDRRACQDPELRSRLEASGQPPRMLVLASAQPHVELPCPSVSVRRPLMEYSLWEALREIRGDSRPGRDSAPAEAAAPLNILVAEDNPINLKVLVTLLKKKGHQVSTAGSGREVLQQFEESLFDLILMDVQMPEGNGFVTTSKIRELEAATPSRVRTPIVALTARAMEEDQHTSREVGMDHYLTKPVQAQTLFSLLEQTQAQRQ